MVVIRYTSKIGHGKKVNLCAYAMKRVTAGAHIPTLWIFELAKRPYDGGDYVRNVAVYRGLTVLQSCLASVRACVSLLTLVSGVSGHTTIEWLSGFE